MISAHKDRSLSGVLEEFDRGYMMLVKAQRSGNLHILMTNAMVPPDTMPAAVKQDTVQTLGIVPGVFACWTGEVPA